MLLIINEDMKTYSKRENYDRVIDLIQTHTPTTTRIHGLMHKKFV